MRKEAGNLMRTPTPRRLALALLAGELACVVLWAFTGAALLLIVGLVAGVGAVFAALRSEG